MAGRTILVVCAQALLIQAISSQCIPNAEIIGPALMPEAMAVAEGLAINPNLGLGPHLALGPNLPANNLGLGNNLAVNNLALGSNWPAFGSGHSWPAGFGSGLGTIAPAALAPPIGIAASNGGCFTVTSTSPIAPTGLTVTSENAVEGALAVAGQLPFLGTVGMDGAFPTAGAGAVSYGCGDDAIGIMSEGVGPAWTMVPSATVAPSLGYGTGMSGGLPYNSVGNRVGGMGYGAMY